jgi:polyhydroxyalkanoate synthesis regulator phasin
MNLHVKIPLDDERRAKAVAAGLPLANPRYFALPLSEDAARLLDPARVRVREDGEVDFLSCVEVENERDIYAPTVVRLSESGYVYSIYAPLFDFIVQRGKAVFDAECVAHAYRLQDEILEKARAMVDAKKERERKLREARELLAGTLRELESRAQRAEERAEVLEKRVRELEAKLQDFAAFILARGLRDEFVAFVASRRAEASRDEIVLGYGLADDEDC